jgi:CBS domain containing-hemolysin-like protein
VGLVRDRTGATLGVVTAEDVLEEIVGELETGPQERN